MAAALFPESETPDLLAEVPRAFLAELDLARETRRISPWLRKRTPDDRLTVACWLRHGWHQHFQDCRVLNDDRLRAVEAALAEFRPVEIAWAIVAYAGEVGRRKDPAMRRTFERLLDSGELGKYVALADKAKAARRAAAVKQQNQREAESRAAAERAERERMESLAARFAKCPPEQQQHYLDRAAGTGSRGVRRRAIALYAKETSA